MGPADQLAILLGKKGHVTLVDCRSFAHRSLALPDGTGFLVADSGVRRRLTGSGYNDRRSELDRALESICENHRRIRSLRDLEIAELEPVCRLLPPVLARLVRHVVEECARVERAAEALEAGHLDVVGELIDDSHASSRDLFEVSLPELDHLAATATASPGCYGARLSGGGFGGCVVALVEDEKAHTIAHALKAAFSERFGREPEVFTCRAEDGAGVETGGSS